MPKIFTVSESGPFRGMFGINPGDIPDGGCEEQVNVFNVPGNPLALAVRLGAVAETPYDRLAAKLWDPTEDYVVGDFVAVQGHTFICTVTHGPNKTASWATVYQGEWTASTAYTTGQIIFAPHGASYGQGPAICLSDHTSGATFAADVAGGKWSGFFAGDHRLGIHAGGLASSAVIGPVVQVIRWTGETILLRNAPLRGIVPQTLDYVAPPSVPSTPTTGTDEWAYLGSYDDNTVVCQLIRVNINPLAASPGTVGIQATTAGIDHRPWIIKGLDGRCYWMFWMNKSGLAATPATLYTHIGHWDGSTLVEMEFQPDGFASGDANKNNWDRDCPPRFLALNKDGEIVIVQDNSQDTEKVRLNDKDIRLPGSINSYDVGYKKSVADIGDDLWAGTGYRADLRYGFAVSDYTAAATSRWPNAGYPQLIGLPNGNMLISNTSKSTLTSPGIGISQFSWGDGGPAAVSGAAKLLTTSLKVADGRNVFYPGRIGLAPDDQYVVARGTNGATLCKLTGEETTIPTASGESIVSALCARDKRRIILADTSSETRIHVYDIDSLSTAARTTYDSDDFVSLTYAFRGMFLSADEKILWVMTYNSGATVGQRNTLVGIPIGYSAWVTGTAYKVGDMVYHAYTVAGAEQIFLYWCAKPHTSGTWATDVAAKDWGSNGNEVTDARDTIHTLNLVSVYSATNPDENVWAFTDSAGSQYRNFTAGGA